MYFVCLISNATHQLPSSKKCLHKWTEREKTFFKVICVSVCFSVCLSICIYVCLSVCLYLCLSVFLFMYVSFVCLVSIETRQFPSNMKCLCKWTEREEKFFYKSFVSQSVSLSVCLSVCLFMSVSTSVSP
jgi:hypothetical protein